MLQHCTVMFMNCIGVISGDMFLNVTGATSSEEGAVDLPGAQARSKAPDVLNS